MGVLRCLLTTTAAAIRIPPILDATSRLVRRWWGAVSISTVLILVLILVTSPCTTIHVSLSTDQIEAAERQADMCIGDNRGGVESRNVNQEMGYGSGRVAIGLDWIGFRQAKRAIYQQTEVQIY